ncbi:MAG: hypothetical protein KBA33_09915 [Cloacibacterium sp.]|nr:hypothetical protein [Cloacibacterium sp.]
MKKLLLFILLPVLIYSQRLTPQFASQDEKKLNENFSEIIKITGVNYVFLEKSAPKKSIEIFRFVNKNNDKDELIIKTYITYEGQNLDLEIKGDKRWSIDNISGRFVVVFPVWKIYIDNNADVDKIIKDQKAETSEDRFTRLFKNENFQNFWTLDL